ncbi:desmocollin-2 isoform A [Alligator mississippiensis]|uniref:Desmocollin-2 isoform A n=1 Tax=Alligator mississippiensis TaxID=8496 RepID=A0A151MNS6_ALLMI|nr:desmocollin-2 isoform A [Alligator mississippiensis]
MDPRAALCHWLLLGLLALNLFCEACKKVTFNVPSTLEAETLIGRVNLEECLRSAEAISSSDPNFRILEDGSVYTTNITTLSAEKKTFTILLKNIQTHEQKKIHVNLLSDQREEHKARHARDTVLRRTKRRWGPIPSHVMENGLGPYPLQIQQIQSDTAQYHKIYYSASGPGINEEPKGLFYIERETGNIFVTRAVDREQYPSFQIICYATTADGYSPEVPLVHTIVIEDDNDNPPYFVNDPFEFCVPENSKPGTLVGTVIAKDLDEPFTLHTRLRYRIVPNIQRPGTCSAFGIHSETGAITLISPAPDREMVEKCMVHVEVRDMDGQSFGLCNTGTVVIHIEDTNDNAPLCEKKPQCNYVIQIEENRANVTLLRIPVSDADKPYTKAWTARFSITKGNDDLAFTITTDKKTNEGLLCLTKGLDYENTRQRTLEITVNNEDPYILGPHSRRLAPCVCTIIVNVVNVDEGPVFNPLILCIEAHDCDKIGTVIGRYTAKDPETGNSEGICYRIAPGQSDWINIDEKTGELRTNKVLETDRVGMKRGESNITVLAIDRSGKTGTGTVRIILKCGNKTPPRILRPRDTACRDGKPVCFEIFDPDKEPYAAPFKTRIADEHMHSLWKTIQNDDKSICLQPKKNAQVGSYKLPLVIRDNGGKEQCTDVTIDLCDCTSEGYCKDIPEPRLPTAQDKFSLGVGAILTMILGSLLLLLILITLCGCWGTAAVGREVTDDCANHNLIISNTEAPGEVVMDPNIIPLQATTVNTCEQVAGLGTIGQGMEQHNFGGHQTIESVKGVSHQTFGTIKGGGQNMDSGRYSYSEWHNFTHPRLGEKVHLCRQDEELKHSEDYVLPYNYEGRGSLAGSVGCCSDRQEEEALDFLDQLEPKFRTLAETCIRR